MSSEHFILYLLVVFFFASCESDQQMKVLYINSYHDGYGSSDDVMNGIRGVLRDKVEMRILFMDTKRNSDPHFIESRVGETSKEIALFQPDIIIASDDNAVKYVVQPHCKVSSIPVVFCGVNWNADQYILPRDQVTGMLEVLPIVETINIVRATFPQIHRLTVLSENSESELKNKVVMEELFKRLNLEVTYSLVSDFDSWKSEFLKANENSDVIYAPTNGAVQNWDIAEAGSFVEEHIQIPVITCDDFMMPYAVFGLTKVAMEQGERAAHTALKILHGASPAEIPIAENRQSQAWVNLVLAEKIGFKLPEELKEHCKIIDKP
ncbi:MAG: hypothetical protein HC819_20515 [Cyclobacteriaceae bacterium]|nr:hypothetical protein [Cyclobacteriaceae bacterium]